MAGIQTIQLTYPLLIFDCRESHEALAHIPIRFPCTITHADSSVKVL